MTGLRGKSGGAVRLGRGAALAATLLAPFAFYFIARTAVAGTGSPGAAAMLATLPPTDYRNVMKGLARATLNPQLKIPAGTAELTREAVRAAPTSFEPFFVAAQTEAQAGRMDRAIALMEEARRRRPSHAATRLQLVAYYGKVERFDALLAELDMALRLNEQARRLVLPELTKLIGDRKGRQALALVLTRRPAWRDDFYAAAQGRKIAPDDVLELMRLIRARGGGGAMPAERQLYLQALVESGDYGRARALWSAGLPAPERGKDGFVFDGGFRGSSAPGPFNWVLSDGDVGRAERTTAGGRPQLDLVYFGGSNVTLAEQTLALPAGRFRLSFLVRSESGIKSGEIAWRITCMRGGKEIAAVPLNGAGPAFARRGAGFEVPADCGGQRLSLTAQPGDVSAEVRAEVASLEIGRG